MRFSDDIALLELMIADAPRQREVYQPGPYWHGKCEDALRELRQQGLAGFRGDSSIVGLSFTDCIHVDFRRNLRRGLRVPLRFLLERVYPFRQAFSAQVALTRSFEAEARRLRAQLYASHPTVRELLARYKMPESLLGGCLDFIESGGRKISTHYLSLLHQHDHLARSLPFDQLRSMLEIGGGFGVNVHLLLENYPRLRKVVYLDIAPNLYVGTQYLKAIYGDAVLDYRQTRERPRLQFSSDERLEILAITPWQIENLDLGVDLIYDAHSFVSMPPAVVNNYVSHMAKLQNFPATSIALLTFDSFDPRTTFNPDLLPTFFPMKQFEKSTFRVLDGRYGIICFVSRR